MNVTFRPAVQVTLLAAIILAVIVVAWRWDPFNRRAHAERRAEANADRAATATLETAGARLALAGSSAAIAQREAARIATAKLEDAAERSEDADELLSPDRAARLREHDRELCLLAPSLLGCAPDRVAAGGDAAVHAAAPR